MSRLRWLAALLALCAAQAAGAQQILIDRGAYVEGLHCYPSAVNEKHWYYIPNTVRFERDDKGRPKFSYLRYVINKPTAEGGAKGITDAEGGGILHLIVVLETPQDTIAAAEQALKRVAQDPELQLQGPVIFKSGRYELISATIEGDKEKKQVNVLAAGNAPVLTPT
jgi:hypothetical protein